VYLTKEVLVWFCNFKIGGQLIHIVKYADDLVLLAKEEAVLQDMTERLSDTGRCYGTEMNVEKPKAMRISRQPTPLQSMIVNNSQKMWNISTIWVVWYPMMQDIHIKLNPGLPWQKQHSTRRLISPANYT